MKTFVKRLLLSFFVVMVVGVLAVVTFAIGLALAPFKQYRISAEGNGSFYDEY